MTLEERQALIEEMQEEIVKFRAGMPEDHFEKLFFDVIHRGHMKVDSPATLNEAIERLEWLQSRRKEGTDKWVVIRTIICLYHQELACREMRENPKIEPRLTPKQTKDLDYYRESLQYSDRVDAGLALEVERQHLIDYKVCCPEEIPYVQAKIALLKKYLGK